LVLVPTGGSAVPPPGLSGLEGERVLLEGGSIERAGVVAGCVVDVKFPGEVPVLGEPYGVIPGGVRLLVYDALNRAAIIIAENLFGAILLGPGVVVMPSISYVEDGDG
jgi:hypothetical protein